jgi:hypothetical protein
MGDADARGGRGLQSIIVYGPLVVGLALLVLGRLVPDLRGGALLASALLLMAVSCLVHAALPSSGEITDEQRALLLQIGVDYRPIMGRVANGILLSLGGLVALVSLD